MCNIKKDIDLLIKRNNILFRFIDEEKEAEYMKKTKTHCIYFKLENIVDLKGNIKKNSEKHSEVNVRINVPVILKFTLTEIEYTIKCDEKNSFDIGSYVSIDAFTGKTNFIGFFEFNGFINDNVSYNNNSTKFRKKDYSKDKFRSVLIIPDINKDDPNNYYIDNIKFSYVDCYTEGKYKHHKPNDTYTGDKALCLDLNDLKKCPDDNIYIRSAVGKNLDEVNLIAKKNNQILKGYEVTSIEYTSMSHSMCDTTVLNYDNWIVYLLSQCIVTPLTKIIEERSEKIFYDENEIKVLHIKEKDKEKDKEIFNTIKLYDGFGNIKITEYNTIYYSHYLKLIANITSKEIATCKYYSKFQSNYVAPKDIEKMPSKRKQDDDDDNKFKRKKRIINKND